MPTATDEEVFTEEDLIILGEPPKCVNCDNNATSKLIFNCCKASALKCDPHALNWLLSMNGRTTDARCGRCGAIWPATATGEQLITVLDL